MSRALAGKRIANTRAVHQAETLNMLLRKCGAVPLPYPCIAIVPPKDTTPLDRALRAAAAGDYDWLVLTSANTVAALAQRLDALGLSLADAPNLSVAAIGPATAAGARDRLSLKVDQAPGEFIAESLAASLGFLPGARVLLPESAIARPTLADALKTAGADITVVEAYRTMPGSGGVDLPRLLAAREIDALTFTSSSTVENFVQRLETEGGTCADLSGVCVACIGPSTARTASACGLSVLVVSQSHSVEGLVEALEVYFENLG